MRALRRWHEWIAALAFVVAACGSDPSGGGTEISVAVVPATASLLTGGIQDFTATVVNDPSNSGVSWSITGCTGGASVCGTLSNTTGTSTTYAAPAIVPPATVGVTAIVISDNTKSFTATVAVTTITATGQIAFVSNRPGDREIYVMNADGTGQVNLTNNPANDDGPVWSPDGSKLAFSSFRDGNREVYVMNADGTGSVNLTNNTANDGGPAWSPDGTKIAFVSNRDGNFEIYVMNADGTGQVNLTNSPANDEDPAWSPDGLKLAFRRDANVRGIYVMNSDGSGAGNLTGLLAFAPTWSADGSKIAFGAWNGSSNPADVFLQVYVMNADGSALRDVTNSRAYDDHPVWSTTGTRIAFSRSPDALGHWELYTTNLDGSGIRNLTNNPAEDREPTWSSDGSKIAFSTNRDGNFEIYVMSAEGLGALRLTNNAASDDAPVWRPR